MPRKCVLPSRMAIVALANDTFGLTNCDCGKSKAISRIRFLPPFIVTQIHPLSSNICL